jgi:glycosyltransferase involved in cell wall biosynthesis
LAPAVSIILPNRNHATYLPTALDAVLRQSWRDIEVIVIDDASSDDSAKIVDRYVRQDPRVVFVPLSEHRGIALGIEAGLHRASGTFLHIAAADDYLAPTFVEKSLLMLMQEPTAGLCFSDPAEFTTDIAQATCFPLRLSNTATYFDPETLISLLNASYFNISTNTIVYRRAAFVDAGGYIPDLARQADVFAATIVALRHGACYVPEQLAFLRIRPGSYSAVDSNTAGAQRDLLYRTLRLYQQPEYADVRERLRRAAFLPEYHPSTLMWLLSWPVGRRFVTGRLIRRILTRVAWGYVRPLTPVPVRRWMRARSLTLFGPGDRR